MFHRVVRSVVTGTLVLALASGCAGLIPRSGYTRAVRQPDGTWVRAKAPPYTFGEQAAVGLNFACAALDIISTEVALAQPGVKEGNPLLRERGVRIPVILGSSLLVWAVGEWTGYRYATNGGKAALHCAAAGWNFHVAREER